MTEHWTLKPGEGIASLRLRQTEPQVPGVGEVRVAIKAHSINARDIMAAMGHSPMPLPNEIIPLSDAAGFVEEIGEGVTQVAPGDRVVITFNPAHQNGPFEPYMSADALGEIRPGVLTRQAVFEERALVKLPDNISFAQAACLPCVAVTAWNALFEAGSLKPGQTVIATGTGTVSLIALKLAKAAGVRFGITSSDDEKIQRALDMGADFGVNYRQRPDWDQAVREATQGEGAHVVLETVGPPSIATSVKAAAHGGRVMQIGFKGMEGPAISALDMLIGNISVIPIMVGSRAMLERLVQAVSLNNISLPIDKQFGFDEAPHAFEMVAGGKAFGKTLISSE